MLPSLTATHPDSVSRDPSLFELALPALESARVFHRLGDLAKHRGRFALDHDVGALGQLADDNHGNRRSESVQPLSRASVIACRHRAQIEAVDLAAYSGLKPDGEYWVFLEVNEGSYGGRPASDGRGGDAGGGESARGFGQACMTGRGPLWRQPTDARVGPCGSGREPWVRSNRASVPAILDFRVVREVQFVPASRLRGRAVRWSDVIDRARQKFEIPVRRFQPCTVVPGTGCDCDVGRGNGHASRASATGKIVGG